LLAILPLDTIHLLLEAQKMYLKISSNLVVVENSVPEICWNRYMQFVDIFKEQEILKNEQL